MIDEAMFEMMACDTARFARRYFTDKSVDRVLNVGAAGVQEWRWVYDVLCGAVTEKLREAFHDRRP
jgi:hypothetical protein